MKRKSFFVRLFIAFILIALLYTVIVMGIYYFKNLELIKFENDSFNKSFVEDISSSLDITLLLTNSVIEQILMEPYVIKYNYREKTDYYDIIKIKAALENISVIFSKTNYIIGITKFSNNTVITPKGTVTVNYFFDDLNISYDDINRINKFYNSKGYPDNQFISVRSTVDHSAYHKKNIITIIKKTLIPGSEDTDFLFFFSFYEDKLIPYSSTIGNGLFAIFDNNRLISICSDNDKITTDLFNKSLSEKLANNINVPSKHINDSLTGYQLYSKNSAVSNWLYIYMVPENNYVNIMQNNFLDTLFISFGLILAGIIAALIMTRKFYKPVLRVVNLFKSHGENIRQDELTYIEKMALKIKKTNESLNTTIKNNRLPLKTKFVRDLLYGLVLSNSIKEKLHRFELEWMDNPLTCAVLELVNHKELDEKFTKEALLNIKSEILYIIKKQLEPNVKCQIFDLDYKRYVIIFKHTNVDYLKELIHTALTGIDFDLELCMVAATGSPCNNVCDIHKSFNTAISLLENRYALSRKTVISLEDMNADFKKRIYYFPENIRKNLINAVLKTDKNTVRLIIDNLLKHNLEGKMLHKNIVYQFFLSIIESISFIANQTGLNMENLFDTDGSLFDELKNCANRKQIQNKIHSYFTILIDRIIAENHKHDEQFKKKMIDFIRHNYCKDIALTDIADEFNLTPGYVSKLFKKLTRENFKDYLNRYRVDRAKEIMKNNKNILVKDLAVKVGCNSTITFIRIFNKYAGTSPGNYLQSLYQ
jgi:two-component system, response regulator YesN